MLVHRDLFELVGESGRETFCKGKLVSVQAWTERGLFSNRNLYCIQFLGFGKQIIEESGLAESRYSLRLNIKLDSRDS